MNKKRVTHTDEEFEGLEESELLAYINYLQQKCEDHKAAAKNLIEGSVERNTESASAWWCSKYLSGGLAHVKRENSLRVRAS